MADRKEELIRLLASQVQSLVVPFRIPSFLCGTASSGKSAPGVKSVRSVPGKHVRIFEYSHDTGPRAYQP